MPSEMLVEDQNIQNTTDNDILLFNQSEILMNIRNADPFVSPILIVISFLFAIFSLITILLNIDDFLKMIFFSNMLLYEHVGSITFLLFFGFMFYISGKASYIFYHWRKGIRDKKIIDNIVKQAAITKGKITEISDKKLFYEYEVKGFFSKDIRTGAFITEQHNKFQVGDVVYVMYVFNLVSFLL